MHHSYLATVLVASCAVVALSAQQPAPAVFAPTTGDYEKADIKVLTPGVVFMSGLPDIAAAWSKESKKSVGINTVGMGTIVDEIGKRQPPPDVIALPFQLMNSLALDGGVVAGTMVPLGRNRMGLAVKAGAPKPDISTPEKFIAAMKGKAVMHSNPASRTMVATIIDDMFKRPEFAGINAVPSLKGEGGQALARGEGDMAIQTISQIFPYKEIELVGPVPKEFGICCGLSRTRCGSRAGWRGLSKVGGWWLVVSGIVTALVLCPAIAHAQLEQTVPVELSTIGLDGRTGTPIVVLRDPESGGVLPVWIGALEAQAIAFALHGVIMPRPMTHDLMASLISELRAEVEEVVVTDLRLNTYFAVVRLRVNGDRRIRDVDSRPSDALALALRTGSPIRVARRILAMAPEFEFIAPEGPNQVVQALGLTVVIPTPALRKEFKLGEQRGVVVTSSAGAVRDKGVRRGDVITEVNGKAIDDPAAFFAAVRAVKPKGQVRIVYSRDGKLRTIEVPADVPPARTGKGGRIAA